MKREFLQSLQTEQPLSKQTMDAIMAENGKDIQAVRSMFADYDALKAQLAQAQAAQTQVEAVWEEKLRQQAEDHQKALQDMEFTHILQGEIANCGGRNAKAVAAMLDLEALKGSDQPRQALLSALQTMQAENPWLFQTQTPPPYARGTGANMLRQEEQPATLAGALREKFERK